jgi:hypothetical protein
VPFCQPRLHSLRRLHITLSDHPASRRLLSPRRSSAILPEYTNPFNDAKCVKQTQKRPWRLRDADQFRCSAEAHRSVPGDLFKHTPFSKDKETASSAWEQTVRMHPCSDSFGTTKVSATRGNQGTSMAKTLFMRSSPPDHQQYWRKSLAAVTILHEDCRSFLHRSRLSACPLCFPAVPSQQSLTKTHLT